MIINASNILEARDYINQYPLAAADTETYGLSFSDDLFSIAVACGDRAFYFNFKDYPEEGVVGLSLKDPVIVENVKGIFNQLKTWAFHNPKFDMHKLRRIGVEVEGDIWCTKIHARVLQNNLLDYSLDTLTKGQKVSKSSAVEEYVKDNKLWTKRRVPGKEKIVTDKHYDKVPFHIMADYAMKDALATLELAKSQMEKYKQDETLHKVRDNEISLVRAIFEMESHGICIDPAYVLEAWNGESALILEAKKAFKLLTGSDYDAINKKELVQILKSFGESIALSDKGNPVLDADALDAMTSEPAKIIQTIRFHEKRISSFYSSFMEHRDSRNVIHANIDQAGTETGRFSMSMPNLQQLSRDGGDEKYAIRRCFVPRPGTCFVQWDYAQQEYRLMADYSNERALINKIMAGYDVHQATADLVGITRTEAKTVNFAVLYGAGAAKLAIMLKISLADARKLIDRYFAAMPMVDNFITRVIGTGKNRGYIFNWLGRKCRIANREWAYILPNHLIQGSGADVMKKAIVKVYELLQQKNAKSKMVLTVHDSLVLEMVAEEFYLIPEITEILESAYTPKNGIVLKTDIEHSYVSLAKGDMKKGPPNVIAA